MMMEVHITVNGNITRRKEKVDESNKYRDLLLFEWR
jgi:hypothetical protein